jgi:hypothetical protein
MSQELVSDATVGVLQATLAAIAADGQAIDGRGPGSSAGISTLTTQIGKTVDPAAHFDDPAHGPGRRARAAAPAA